MNYNCGQVYAFIAGEPGFQITAEPFWPQLEIKVFRLEFSNTFKISQPPLMAISGKFRFFKFTKFLLHFGKTISQEIICKLHTVFGINNSNHESLKFEHLYEKKSRETADFINDPLARRQCIFVVGASSHFISCFEIYS